MPVKFSSLTNKGIANASYVIGLYNDPNSSTTLGNCKITITDFAKSSELTTLKNTVQNDVVHKAGDETISGTKTFTSASGITYKGNDDFAAATANKSDNILVGKDSTGKTINTLFNYRAYSSTEGNSSTGYFLRSYKLGDTSAYSDVRSMVSDGGNATLTYITSSNLTNMSLTGVSTSTTDTTIPTKGWINNTLTSTNVVHRNSEETISGAKTFTGSIIKSANTTAEYTTKISNYTKGNKPSSISYGIFKIVDSNNTEIGSFFKRIGTDGDVSVRMNSKSLDTSSSAYIAVGHKADGTVYTYAPTPTTTDDNSTQIATTSWVVNHRCKTKATTSSSASITAPCYIIENYVNGKKWYRIWSDGWIEQGGEAESQVDFLLAKPFANTNYTVVNGPFEKHDQNAWIRNKTTTTIQFHYKSSFYACGY